MKRPFQPRKYNRRVTIEAITTTADDSGGQTETWASIGNAWVEATPVAGKELLAAGALQSSQGWRIETWYRTDITTSHRLSASWLNSDWRIFIESVADPDGRRERLVLFGTASQAFDLEEL